MECGKVCSSMMAVFNEDIKTNNEPSYITDLILITIKSLVPSRDFIKVSIDYNRYSEEIKLWKDYRHGDNSSLLNLFNGISPEVYWKERDDSVYPRILPIVLVNQDFIHIKEEVIKNVLFTTGDIETLLEAILISKMMYLSISNVDNIIEKLKEEIINLSQIDFIEEYNKFYRASINGYEKEFKVAFEQRKIYALNTLNFSYSQGFQTLKDCLEVLFKKGIGNTIMGQCLKGLLDNKIEEDFNIDNYYKELSLYLYRLRKSKIDPEVLRIEKYYLPDIFKFNEGEVFYHSLLNKCTVIKKEKVGNSTIVYLDTKSGIYRFKK